LSLHTPICDLFGIEHPVFLAGMGQVAYADICGAVSNAGGYGTLGMVAGPAERVREEMRATRKLTDKPFGVDMLAALPEQMNACIDTIIEEGASSFITGLGVARPLIQKCHDNGLLVMAVCGKVSHAQRAEEAGCDAVVAQGGEAGGHTGQVAGMALIPQVVDAVDIPVIAAGSIVNGRGLAAALSLGAQAVWMGTRFIASHEAQASQKYKKRLTLAQGDETSITRFYSGKPMRVLRNAYVDERERSGDRPLPFPQQMIQSVQDGLLSFADDEHTDEARSCMPAGQGVGGITEIIPAGDIVREVVRDAEAVLAHIDAYRS
jgi:enoyl-[acyl-carrier protein] reductase II